MKSTFALLALSGLSAAAPLEARKEAVSATVFDKLGFFAQYSAAAYCKGNNDSPNSKVVCGDKRCEKVEAAKTNTLLEFENSKDTDTTGFVATDSTNNLIVLSFRGSKSIDNWVSNLNFGLEDNSVCKGCEVHGGFLESWNEVKDKVLKSVKDAATKNPKFKIVATGHSLGGALATLATADLRSAGTSVDLYTYGAPKVGNDKFNSFLGKTEKGLTHHSVHKADLVPTLPPSIPILSPYENNAPVYYISSGNVSPVKAADVSIFKADQDDENPGDNVEAHGWYYGQISKCKGDDKIGTKIGS
ncbi:alpha/beta-hydrolase [Periconia macrospinosa]|uniref:Alpha/beta-hydrolase n=1 Tax=Periconia macrospinosa TaxID=97972 RepID=A0A2V1DQD4_9PLEO|nr:alpha/beta-hydrolase [Periconia macrospinosa]